MIVLVFVAIKVEISQSNFETLLGKVQGTIYYVSNVAVGNPLKYLIWLEKNVAVIDWLMKTFAEWLSFIDEFLIYQSIIEHKCIPNLFVLIDLFIVQ